MGGVCDTVGQCQVCTIAVSCFIPILSVPMLLITEVCTIAVSCFIPILPIHVTPILVYKVSLVPFQFGRLSYCDCCDRAKLEL